MTWGLKEVTVTFGSRVALAAVSVEAAPGSVAVLAGGDGSGKSTVLRAMAGLVRHSEGEIARPAEERIGYQPTSSGVYPDLTVTENLAFAGAAHNLPRAEIARRAAPLLERTKLTIAAGRLGGQLSGGMRQKLGFALAILHRPDLLLLDEPTTGLDPVSRAELWRLIASEAARGASVLMAASYIDEAERAEHVVVLDQGRLLVAGRPDEVIDSVPGAVLTTSRRPDSSLRWRRGSSWRMWSPTGASSTGARRIEPDLEDAVVVAAMAGAESGEAVA
jgi:ABC-2 type transport system ATP-binding protein